MRRRRLEARQAELLPVAYYHVVFTLPAELADIAYQNKAVVYDILFKAASQALLTIAADPKHLGARIGVTAVLHSWGSAMTHHPHVHCIVPGGGLSADGLSWVSCRPRFFLPVRVLSRLFRRLFLDKLADAHLEGRLGFFGDLASLADRSAFITRVAPLRRREWVVYAKRPFAGPEAVLAYLARYTHRVAISSSRLVSLDERGVTFGWKDYRAEGDARRKLMTLDADEFIRRFLIHVLPTGFHRIRHYGLFANAARSANLAKVRALLQPPPPPAAQDDAEPPIPKPPRACPCCGGRMLLIETFERGVAPRPRPSGRCSGSTPHDPHSPELIRHHGPAKPVRAQASACARSRLREAAGVATATSAPLRPRYPSSGAPVQLSRRVLIADSADVLGQAAALKSP